jgi:hypothetical protein
VNTNEKTTAATVLMSTFIALAKFRIYFLFLAKNYFICKMGT